MATSFRFRGPSKEYWARLGAAASVLTLIGFGIALVSLRSDGGEDGASPTTQGVNESDDLASGSSSAGAEVQVDAAGPTTSETATVTIAPSASESESLPQTATTISTTTTLMPGGEVPLASLEPVEMANCDWQTGTMNGQQFDNVLFCHTSKPARAEFRLDRKFQTLRLTVGISGDSDFDTQGVFDLYDESGRLAYETVGIGTTEFVEVNVSEALRIRIFLSDSVGTNDLDLIGIGDAVLVAK